MTGSGQQIALPINPLVCIGVDWLTCSFRPGYSQEWLEVTSERLLSAERARGNFVRRWSNMGYEGFKCGQVQIGTRPDGALFRVSGHAAGREWRYLVRSCDNVSRLDLQFTTRDGMEPWKRIAKHFAEARRWKKKRGHGPSLTFIRNDVDGYTCYFGKRVSDRYGRIYDKGRESKLPEFDGCVRYELELKAVAACRMAKFLTCCSDVDQVTASQVGLYFRERGVHLPASVATRLEMTSSPMLPELPEAVADISKKLLWLETQVQPTVERLISAGHYASVLKVLQLDQGLNRSQKEE